MPALNERQIDSINRRANDAALEFKKESDHKPPNRMRADAALGTWLPVVGTAVGAYLGSRQDRKAKKSFKAKVEMARCMEAFYTAKQYGAEGNELETYKEAFSQAKIKAETLNKKAPTPWGELVGDIAISREHHKEIYEAGKAGKSQGYADSKEPYWHSKALSFSLIGTLVFPILGTIAGIVIGKYYKSSAIVKREQYVELKAATARQEKAESFVESGQYEKEDITGFVKDKTRTETLYDQGYQRNNAVSWGAGVMTLLTWVFGGGIGAFVGKAMNNSHDESVRKTADMKAENAARNYSGAPSKEKEQEKGRGKEIEGSGRGNGQGRASEADPKVRFADGGKVHRIDQQQPADTHLSQTSVSNATAASQQARDSRQR